jgi:hypothetical protein
MATYKELVALTKSVKSDTEMQLVVDGKEVTKKGSDLKNYLMTLYSRPHLVTIEAIEEPVKPKAILKTKKIDSDGESL